MGGYRINFKYGLSWERILLVFIIFIDKITDKIIDKIAVCLLFVYNNKGLKCFYDHYIFDT